LCFLGLGSGCKDQMVESDKSDKRIGWMADLSGAFCAIGGVRP
jgi:hypothetical protein